MGFGIMAFMAGVGGLRKYIDRAIPRLKESTKYDSIPVSDLNTNHIHLQAPRLHYHHTILSTSNATSPIHNMSSPATQYVYIPNLVGRQMLRIPIEEVETEGQISTTQQPIASPTLSSRYTRDSSPSPSMESVSSTDE
jgi:hypothetical protein